nr:fatty acid cis/trans isomerase [Pseudomonas sp. N040]
MHLRLLTGLLAFGSLAVQAAPVSYSKDVQPIFERNCIACHACYDAPCQLNLGSGEGVQRGASKALVYDGGRLRQAQPTQLWFDAHTQEQWRQRGFFSVLDARGQPAALMSRMLQLGHDAPLTPNARLPDSLDISSYRQNQCPRPDEFTAFSKDSPGVGMPFAVTGLAPADYQTLQDWLAQGAPLDQQPVLASAAEAAQISEWENLLNAAGARQALVGRWLYEHLFLAHLYFEGSGSGHFFQLVRSRTPSGQPVDVIASRRPNDDPGTQFFYRIRPIQGAIVRKTHITYPLSAQKLARVNQLFFAADWSTDSVPGYGLGSQANPFVTFAAIPAKARYQFMLDNAEYFVRTFIRGPVCRGQIATDVIRDQFWTLFQDPRHDLYVNDADYRSQVDPLLKMPGLAVDLQSAIREWPTDRDNRNEYLAIRQEAYGDRPAPGWDTIWTGNDNALLTIFRHFDSAEVHKGLAGAVPQTMWMMDYPLLEQTYYGLVVNFDVYGSAAHQAQTRMYFDLIRNASEINLLRLLSADARQDILDSWYGGASGRLTLWMDYQTIDTDTDTGLSLLPGEPYAAFAKGLLAHTAAINATPDPLNRCTGDSCFNAAIAPELQDAEQQLSRLAARKASSLPVIDQLPEVTLLRIETGDGGRAVYSLLRNRAHSNVAYMLGESLRYEPLKDSLTIAPGVLGNYPNFLINLPAGEVAEFVDAMEQVQPASGLTGLLDGLNKAQDDTGFEKIMARWGVRRSNLQFWFYFNDLTTFQRETAPLEAGYLDMSRFENL